MLQDPVIVSAFVLAMSLFFSSLVGHLAGMCFVHVGSLERCCCCLRGLLDDGSDTNDVCFSFFGGRRGGGKIFSTQVQR